MVEVIPVSSQRQYPSDAMEADMMEMSGRLMTTTLGSVHEELKKGIPKDEGAKHAGELHVPPRRAFTTSNYLLPTTSVSRAAESTTNRDLYLKPGSEGAMVPRTPRSYSVMDYEPVPFTQQPGTTLQLSHLPAELHYALFEFLDPIDSVCLALTSRHFYAVHWAIHGKVSLAARREGPNDMEWVWRNAGPFQLYRGGQFGGHNSLALLSPRGQVYCRKCRTARCELHKHIKEWMGPGLEYCLVTQKFGPEPPLNAKGFCYRSSPRHPNRCGRHTRNRRAVRLA